MSALFFYTSCAKSKCFFFLIWERRRKRRKILEKEEENISSTCCITSGTDCWRITFLALSRLFGNSLTSPSLYLHVAFSVFPFSFGCIHFTVIRLSLKSPSLFAPSSPPALSFYLSRNNGGVKWGTGSLAHHVGAHGLNDITLCYRLPFLGFLAS